MGNIGVIGNWHNYRSLKWGKLGRILVLNLFLIYMEGKKNNYSLISFVLKVEWNTWVQNFKMKGEFKRNKLSQFWGKINFSVEGYLNLESSNLKLIKNLIMFYTEGKKK